MAWIAVLIMSFALQKDVLDTSAHKYVCTSPKSAEISHHGILHDQDRISAPSEYSKHILRMPEKNPVFFTRAQ